MLIYIMLAFWVIVAGAFIFMIRLLGKPANTHLRKEKKEKETVNREDHKGNQKTCHISDLIKIDDIYQGVYQKNGVFYAIARLSGTNFDVMTDYEQDSRENILISILSEVSYPVQTVTTTIISDIDEMVAGILEGTKRKPDNHPQAIYGYNLAGELFNMKMDHRIMSRQNWLIISANNVESDEDPVQKINEYMYLLSENMRSKAKIFVTPITDSAEMLDVIYQILLPLSIIKPSDRIAEGINEPFHFKVGEMKEAQEVAV